MKSVRRGLVVYTYVCQRELRFLSETSKRGDFNVRKSETIETIDE
jgi:hypothetical protein